MIIILLDTKKPSCGYHITRNSSTTEKKKLRKLKKQGGYFILHLLPPNHDPSLSLVRTGYVNDSMGYLNLTEHRNVKRKQFSLSTPPYIEINKCAHIHTHMYIYTLYIYIFIYTLLIHT